ncbi:MAG: carbohydrate-binding protein [Oscillospiraceae bacterium]|nr:carbohydrate-binding protein [Oscillospiraceae bacterium]
MRKYFKRSLAVLTAFCAFLSATAYFPENVNQVTEAAAVLPAFPGAKGGGSLATGGRGGKVIHVTNLNDSGEGSFREAVGTSNSIVVFDVGGTIELKGDVVVASNVTIAGQTAPGGAGVTLKNYKLGFGGDNIICRFISSRPGERGTNTDYDAWGGAKGANSIVDHCSIGWANDEQWGLYSANDNVTVQYTVLGPSNSFSYHSKGIHGFGIMLGRTNVTWDHNLIVHNVSRNFRGKVPGTGVVDFTNNVIYNWASQTAYGTIGHVNYVGNTLKKGVSTVGGHNYVSVGDSGTAPENYSIYLMGNRFLNKDNSQYNNYSDNNWAGIKYGDGKNESNTRSNSPFTMTVNGVNVSSMQTIESSNVAYENVLNYAGNGIAPDKRIAIDQQVAYETRTGTGTLTGARPYNEATADQKATIDKYSMQCGITYQYPAPVLQKEITDADNDGMADDWEIARGLDPNDPTDTNSDYCGLGYTNIEYYINDLTVNAFPKGVVELSPTNVTIEKVSAFSQIEAENYSDQSGVTVEDLDDGGKCVGYIENGDYILFRRVDFENGAKSFSARVAGNAAKIELYLDSLNGRPFTVCDFEGTGGWQDWKDVIVNMKSVSGTHNLYVKFTGGESYLLNIDHFSFSKEPVLITDRLITSLFVNDDSNADNWIVSDDLQLGANVFGDRDFTYASVPDELIGAEYIKTACESKYYSADLAEFTAGKNLIAYVGYDNRIANVPAWLSEWEKTGETTVDNNGVTFDLYKKSFKQGETVFLGSNNESYQCVSYTVYAVQDGESIPEPIEGDVNQDGERSVLDIILFQKYLLDLENLNAEQANAADLNADGRLNAFDLAALKRLYLSN